MSPSRLMYYVSRNDCIGMFSLLDFQRLEPLNTLPRLIATYSSYFSDCYRQATFSKDSQRALFSRYFGQSDFHTILFPLELVHRHRELHDLISRADGAWDLRLVSLPSSALRFSEDELLLCLGSLVAHPERCGCKWTFLAANRVLGSTWHWGGPPELFQQHSASLFVLIDRTFQALLRFWGAPHPSTRKGPFASPLFKADDDVIVDDGILSLLNNLTEETTFLESYQIILERMRLVTRQLSPVHDAFWRGKLLVLTLYNLTQTLAAEPIILEYFVTAHPEALPVVILERVLKWSTDANFSFSPEQCRAVRPVLDRIAKLFPSSQVMGGTVKERTSAWANWISTLQRMPCQVPSYTLDLPGLAAWFGSYEHLTQVILMPMVLESPIRVIVGPNSAQPTTVYNLLELLQILGDYIEFEVARLDILSKHQISSYERGLVKALARLLATNLVYLGSPGVALPNPLVEFLYTESAKSTPAFVEFKLQLVDYAMLTMYLPQNKLIPA